MGVTFSAIGGPMIMVQDIDYDGNPAFDEVTGLPVLYQTSALPTLNLNNANAAAILSLINHPFPECGYGEFRVGELPELRRSIIRALSTRVTHVVREPETTGRELRRLDSENNVVTVGRGCVVHHCGIDEAGIRARLQILFDLVVAAQHHKLPIGFC